MNNLGVLASIGTSPYPDYQNAPCWVELSHDGQYLFTVNTASSSISSYSIAPDGSLSLLGSTPFSGSVHGEEDARLDPTGRNLYVVDSGSGAVSSFGVNGGTLTELGAPVALPIGSHAFGIVVD